MSEVVGEATELSDLSYCSGCWEIFDGLDFLLSWQYAFFWNDETEVINRFCSKDTFLCLKFDAIFSQTEEQLPEEVDVLAVVFAVGDKVVQVCNDGGEVSGDVVGDPGEGGWWSV